jgi:hypothetical protein
LFIRQHGSKGMLAIPLINESFSHYINSQVLKNAKKRKTKFTKKAILKVGSLSFEIIRRKILE